MKHRGRTPGAVSGSFAPAGKAAREAAVVLGGADAFIIETGDGPRVYSLQGADESYRRLVEGMTDAVLVLSADHAILYCNGRLAEILGQAGLAGRDFLDLVAPEQRRFVAALLEIGAKNRGSAEMRCVTTQGDKIAMRASVAPIAFDGQACVALVIGKLDETAALRESEERLRELGDSLPDSFIYRYAQKPGGAPRFLYLSAGVEKLNGVTAAEALADPKILLDQILPEYRLSLAEAEQRSARDLTDFYMELPMRRGDGSLRWMRLQSRPQRLPDSTVIWRGVQTDITERRQAEEALHRSQALMAHAADAARLTYAELDLTTGRFQIADNFVEVMGYQPLSPSEGVTLSLALANLLKHIAPADHGLVQQVHQKILGGQKSGAVQCRVQDNDGGERCIEGTWKVETGIGGKPSRVITTGLDITSLVAAKAEAEHANLAKSKFLAAASHDLRQPVQSLTLLLSVIKRQVADRAKAAEALEMAQASVNSLNGMLSSILDISRLDAGVIAPVIDCVDIGALVDRLAREYGARAAASRLKLRVRSRDMYGRTDAALLERILRNLIENALRYTATGGILIGLRQRGGNVRIDVIDTGMGVPADKQAEIFEEFRQLNNPARDSSRGLGLGLAIVSRLARLLGIEVEVSSRLHRGTRFSLLVPMDASVPEKVEDRPTLDNPGGRILVIEDNGDVRAAYEIMLADWGYAPLNAANGEAAIALAAAEAWRFDAILADYRLGAGLTGTAAAAEIARQAGKTIPTLIVTGDTSAQRISHIDASGFAMMHKPVSAEDLRRKLAGLISNAAAMQDKS